MRRFLTGFVIAAIVTIIPAMALAGNQEVAEQIANQLAQKRQTERLQNWCEVPRWDRMAPGTRLEPRANEGGPASGVSGLER